MLDWMIEWWNTFYYHCKKSNWAIYSLNLNLILTVIFSFFHQPCSFHAVKWSTIDKHTLFWLFRWILKNIHHHYSEPHTLDVSLYTMIVLKIDLSRWGIFWFQVKSAGKLTEPYWLIYAIMKINNFSTKSESCSKMEQYTI